MVSSVLIILVSAVLLGYWFRYTCLLILNTKGAKDYSAEVAAANDLSFPYVVGRLKQGEELGALHEMLSQDYRLLSYLLRHTMSYQAGGLTIEQRLLSLDFQLMRAWYGITRPFSASHAQRALEEMSQVVAHFANAMGERSAESARA
jgi:hypothetical protein